MKIARLRYQAETVEASVLDEGFLVRTDGQERLIAPGEAELLPPSRPSKIMAIGWNFPEHIEEMKGRLKERALEERPAEPIVFFKPPSCLVPAGRPIVFPLDAARVEYEGELVLVVDRRCRRVSPQEALGFVRGWTCGNDVTEREMQRADKQWWRAKGYDTFGPVGPYLETEVPDPDAEIRTYLNGELRQQGRVRDMLFDPAAVLSYVSQALTLEPGDLIMLGTPPGVGALRPGDVVRVEIEGVGELENPVVAEPA
ncbi:MAG: fumarylacetoacetate hydrolase family protein [Thermoleophilia bacterium]